MNYLDDSEYAAYGLEEGTPDAWIASASALIDSYCRRATLGVAQYTERVQLNGRYLARLTYLPLAVADGAVSPLVTICVRYGMPRRGEMVVENPFSEAAGAFGMAGEWITVAVESLDWDADTGEITLPGHPLGLPYNEIKVTYTAGMATIADPVKCACAQIVRNAQATPGLNVQVTQMDRMKMQYFSDSLLDDSVRRMLAPYVAQKVG